MDINFFYRCLKAEYRDQKHEFKVLRKFLRPDHIAIDIGSNKGSYLLVMASSVPKGQVIAFEPQPSLHSYLLRQIDSRFLKNVSIEPLAISSSSGNEMLHLPDGENVSPSASIAQGKTSVRNNSYVVETITLDHFFENNIPTKKIGAIKIDVEGHEIEVLKGAINTINRNYPVVICESECRHIGVEGLNEVFDFFITKNFKGYFVHPLKGLLPLETFNSEIHQNQDGPRFWDKKTYCNNFVFIEKNAE